MPDGPVISVVVPAYDAEQTLPATLDSLQRQTHSDWEAIVVDDGSTDATAAIVEERARHDARLRLVRQANGGVSAARNAGIAAARGTWLAFLDADDWLAPEAFATLLAALHARPGLDGVHCGWTRIAPDGSTSHEICPRAEEDMFSWHAHNCGFAIHAVMVRRSLVERAGGFDPGLTTCEDWDLWMRLSRLGTRWERIDAQLAYYRVRELSASMASQQMLDDGLVVIDRAHGPDERLADLPPARRKGEDVGQRSRARLVHAVYSAGLAVGQGRDAVSMLDAVAADRCPELGQDQVAYALFEGVPLGAGTVPSDWASFSPQLIEHVGRLLDAIERISGAPELARRSRRMLERLVVPAQAHGSIFGRIQSVGVDLEAPLADLAVAQATERLLVHPRYGGRELPKLELPAWDCRVPAELIADAVAAEHAWAILGAFFDTTEAVHDVDGWERMLQETWGDPEAGNAAFYDAAHDDEVQAAGCEEVTAGWAVVELSQPLHELACDGPVDVVARVGGATLTTAVVEPVDGRVTAGALRRAICTQAGFELCRLVVREALIGRQLQGGPGLRERLREAAAAREAATVHAGVVAAGAVAGHVSIAPGWERHALRALNGDAAAYVIARRRGAATGLSGSRVAAIPRAAADDAVAGARDAGDVVIAVGAPQPGAAAVYAPDIVWQDRDGGAGANGAAPAERPAVVSIPGSGRAVFEAIFARGPDPWRYTSDYEQGKYEQTLSLLPELAPRRALELGCAEGHFTQQLAARVERLDALDVSAVALERARQRCTQLANVSFAHHDVFSDSLDGRYDLIVCSEVLYYAGDRERLDHAVHAIATALEPGGTLLSTHANLVVDDPAQPGFDWDMPFGGRVIGEAFAASGLELAHELANPLYRVQAFRRPARRPRLRRPQTIHAEAALPATLPRDVEQQFLWDGGEPARAGGEGGPLTWELPLLMYHRVAPTGHERLREWRVTPGQFEQQLHYLRTAGYTSASFEEWRAAAEGHRPLPGRRLMLTFDDGYEDFAEHAHPLLRQYELEATVFLVSERVGGVNAWDSGYGETLPLMDWDTIRALDGDGVSFGGHSATHPMLTGLGLDEVVREASRCRAELVEQLGHVVRSFAYPYGDVDDGVARTVGACGFEFGVTTEGFIASGSIPMLSLPRMNVGRMVSFDAFVRMLIPSGAHAPGGA